MSKNDKIYDLLEKVYMELQETKTELKSEINSVKIELKEFRNETNARFNHLENKLDDIEANNADRHVTLNGDIRDMKSDISRIEMNTADNWKDIVRLKSIRRHKTK